MGLLSAGEPMTWEEMKAWQDHVRHHGVKQFIRLYNRLKVIKEGVNKKYLSCEHVRDRMWGGGGGRGHHVGG